jgi:hypothetical protein
MIRLERRAGQAVGQQTVNLINEVRSQLQTEIEKTRCAAELPKQSSAVMWVFMCLMSLASLALGAMNDRWFLR